MGKSYLILVPKSLSYDFNVYPRLGYRTAFLMYGAFFLMWFQFNRYMQIAKNRSKGFGEYVNWNSIYAPQKVRYPQTKQEVEYQKKYPHIP